MGGNNAFQTLVTAVWHDITVIPSALCSESISASSVETLGYFGICFHTMAEPSKGLQACSGLQGQGVFHVSESDGGGVVSWRTHALPQNRGLVHSSFNQAIGLRKCCLF